jgi:hypothetical protein
MTTSIHSEYYGTTLELTDTQLETILDLYLEWCEDNKSQPEVEDIETMKEVPSTLDHAMYHAEITDIDNELEFLEFYN